MPKGIKQCKVCGRDYEYCRTLYPNNSIYRWQDVACCAEHGAIYFARVMEARNGGAPTEQEQRAVIEENEIADEYEELFESDFDDNDSDLDIN